MPRSVRVRISHKHLLVCVRWSAQETDLTQLRAKLVALESQNLRVCTLQERAIRIELVRPRLVLSVNRHGKMMMLLHRSHFAEYRQAFRLALLSLESVLGDADLILQTFTPVALFTTLKFPPPAHLATRDASYRTRFMGRAKLYNATMSRTGRVWLRCIGSKAIQILDQTMPDKHQLPSDVLQALARWWHRLR